MGVLRCRVGRERSEDDDEADGQAPESGNTEGELCGPGEIDIPSGFPVLRVEENPDLEHGIHGLVITNEPDAWMVNRLDKTARHIVDPGPTYNCQLPMFVNGEEIKSAEDLNRQPMQLEFGRELEYFRPRSAAPNPGPALQGKPTMVYTVQAGRSQLFLLTSGDPEVPVAVVRKNGKTHETFWYGEYAQVPFDATLFVKPEGVKIGEMKP